MKTRTVTIFVILAAITYLAILQLLVTLEQQTRQEYYGRLADEAAQRAQVQNFTTNQEYMTVGYFTNRYADLKKIWLWGGPIISTIIIWISIFAGNKLLTINRKTQVKNKAQNTLT